MLDVFDFTTLISWEGYHHETSSIPSECCRRCCGNRRCRTGHRAVSPDLRWRLQSGFPKSLDTIYGAAETFAKFVNEATDGKFQIQCFAAGEIVGAAQIADAVGNSTVEMSHTCSYYYFGKDPTFAIGTALPFGLNSRQMNAWLYQGGGNDLLNEFYAKHNMYGLPGGNTGTQMGGWFRREIKTVADLNGLKFRIAGLAGLVMASSAPCRADRGRRHLSCARARHDRRRRVGRPYDDEKLGFEGGAVLLSSGLLGRRSGRPLHVQQREVEGTPEELPGDRADRGRLCQPWRWAKYDAKNPAALRRLVVANAQLRPFPQEVLEAAYKAANEVYDERVQNPDFKKPHEAVRAFRGGGFWY